MPWRQVELRSVLRAFNLSVSASTPLPLPTTPTLFLPLKWCRWATASSPTAPNPLLRALVSSFVFLFFAAAVHFSGCCPLECVSIVTAVKIVIAVEIVGGEGVDSALAQPSAAAQGRNRYNLGRQDKENALCVGDGRNGRTGVSLAVARLSSVLKNVLLFWSLVSSLRSHP